MEPNIEHETTTYFARLSEMAKPGNFGPNAAAESFLDNLKSERIKVQIFNTRVQCKLEALDSLKSFYDRVRRHKHIDQIRPMDFAEWHQASL